MCKSKAVIYMRTSSAANVGEDKDSHKRQESACRSYAKANKLVVDHVFYDAAVKGTDPVIGRPGFVELIAYCEENGIKTILFESASRFSRDLMVQEVAHSQLSEQGYMLIPADVPDLFTNNDPSRIMIRQVFGAVSQFQKSELSAKLKVARDRKKAENKAKGITTLDGRGKVSGRKTTKELNPAMVREAKRLRRKNRETGKRMSLRKIIAALFDQGYMTANGKPISINTLRNMLGE